MFMKYQAVITAQSIKLTPEAINPVFRVLSDRPGVFELYISI
jgi:hypothetical protein